MHIPRRHFLHTSMRAGILAQIAGIGNLDVLPHISAAEAKLPAQWVRFAPGIEPLVRVIEDTPRERVIEEITARIRRGLSYRELIAALFLAGIRNIQPRPIGFKFHAVLVVHAAHLAALASPDSDRWLPILWAVDQFKSSQERDIQEGDWAMAAIEAKAIPDAEHARESFRNAMESWDESAADAAIVGLARTASAHEIFEILCRFGIRDFRELGHKLIYICNAFRALEVIGWEHAEPVLRGVTYALLDRVGDPNPSRSDLPADRPYRRNLAAVGQIRAEWMGGTSNPSAANELLEATRTGSAIDASAAVVGLLNRGIAATSVIDGLHVAAGELLMRQPGIFALHAHTFTNAVHYAWRHVRDDETRRLLLLQNAAFLPLYRGEPKQKRVQIDSLEAVAPSAKDSAEGLAEIFAGIGPDTLGSASKLLGWLKAQPQPQAFAAAARRLIFLKGRDAHDYKFSSAVFEDLSHVDPAWRDRFLAASVFNLRGSSETDNPLVQRIQTALAR